MRVRAYAMYELVDVSISVIRVEIYIGFVDTKEKLEPILTAVKRALASKKTNT